MSHDPLRGAFERMAPQQVSPAEARDRLGALSPGFRTARRNHRIRTGVAGVTAAIALTVGGAVAIAAIAPRSSTPTIDFASPDKSIDESVGNEAADEASLDESVDTDTSSSSEEVPDGATETVASSDESDDPSDDPEATEHDSDTLGHEAGSDDDDDSDSDDDEDGTDAGEAVIDGVTYSRSGPGGTLSVRVVGGVLELVEAAPASGFSADVDNEGGDDIRVDFSAGSDELRIEVEYEYGQLFWTVED